MADPAELLIAATIEAHQQKRIDGFEFINCACSRYGSLHDWSAAHVAAEVVAALGSWDFLMALLDQHYPESIFPTTLDNPDLDPGPRIVSLIRVIDQLRRERDHV